jgi:hypothetical protein
MKSIFTPEVYLPLALLILGAAIPSAFFIFAPEYPLFDTDLYYWHAVFLTLSGSIVAIKMTFSRLISINPQINKEMIFVTEGNLQSEQALLGAHARTAELMIMGLVFLSLITDEMPQDFASVLLFTSLRIGGILFLLGGIVMAITHVKMRKL